MTQVLDFPLYSEGAPRRIARVPRHGRRDAEDFWPDIMSTVPSEDASVEAANTPRRVLFEVFLVLAAALAAVAAVAWLVPAP